MDIKDFHSFYDPKVDIAFKRIFGQKENINITIDFLNSMLEVEKPIKSIENPELSSKKESKIDVLCIDTIGVKYIIEMQVSPDRHFMKRA